MTVNEVVRVSPDDSDSEDCFPFFENFRRGDHVITDIGVEGTTDQTFYRANFWLGRNYVESWADPGPMDIGTYASNDDDTMATFHLIRTHSVAEGWREDRDVNVYELLTTALDDIWEKNEENIIRPMRIWFPGWRSCNMPPEKCSPKILGEVKMVEDRMWEALANTECELAVWLM